MGDIKQKAKLIARNNWLFIFIVVAVQIKSIMLLSMLRTPGSAVINLDSVYFGVPVKVAHWAIITLIFSGIYLFKEKGKFKAAIIIDIIITILFIADIWYYRANGAFISLRHLLHPEIFNPTNRSLFNFQIVDLVFFIDIIIVVIIGKFIKLENGKYDFKIQYRIGQAVIFALASIGVLMYNHEQVDIKGDPLGRSLFRLSWAPYQTYSDMSPLGYHGFDIQYFNNKTRELNNQDMEDVEKWINNNKENIKDNKYKGMLEGKNLIAIQVESLENFVINKKVNGQEITPTLNKLLSNSLYFDNIYEQNNSGTSSDADLLVNTSIFPVRKDRTFLAFPWTEYISLQSILKNENYTTISTHGEKAGSWNWGEAHKSFNVDKMWDIDDFNVDEVIGPGISDETYLKQIANKLKDEKDPFYTFIATITSHGPFDIPDEKKSLKLPKELDENMLGAYFQSIRYTDESIKLFLEELDKNGQLDNSVIMIYGDHGGIHKFYADKIEGAPLEGNWWQEDDKKLPFIIYNKDIKGEVVSKHGGQVDFLPTISYLLGVDRNKFDNTSMGRILVNTNRDATILNNGEIKGVPKNESESKHLQDTFKIADNIIEGNYFKIKDK